MKMTMSQDPALARREAPIKIDFIDEIIKKAEMAGEDDPEYYSKGGNNARQRHAEILQA